MSKTLSEPEPKVTGKSFLRMYGFLLQCCLV